MTHTRKSAPPEPLQFETAQEAFEAVKPRLAGVATNELVPINLDVSTAVTVALGAAPRVLELRDAIEALPGIDVDAALNLRAYAMAALYAHVVTQQRRSDGGFAALVAEASKLRAALLVAAEALAHRELLPADRVAQIRSGQGHLDVANDLVALSALFGEHWAQVEHKTAVAFDEVEHAAVLGSQLHVALGTRRIGAPQSFMQEDAAHSQRERAFTLFMRAYDECRRAVTYLRWHEGDADAITPSLYARRRRRTLDETTASEVPTTPVGEQPASAASTDPEPVA